MPSTKLQTAGKYRDTVVVKRQVNDRDSLGHWKERTSNEIEIRRATIMPIGAGETWNDRIQPEATHLVRLRWSTGAASIRPRDRLIWQSDGNRVLEITRTLDMRGDRRELSLECKELL